MTGLVYLGGQITYPRAAREREDYWIVHMEDR
ncbi:hypothetical protein BDA96_08G094100 [Sorghum bicolor]|uniref:Uncharacterized protein n=1 Tax=Sorghum bicolor TaxID=4558 RepID=A0A921QHN5_SORBI|nr:hypothetical protein BDA96_08G094100 [Sorghum bicolor]